jgi:hypothetical protein
LYLRVCGLAPADQATGVWPDQVQLDVNGQTIDPDQVRREHRDEAQCKREGCTIGAHTLLWFQLQSPPAEHGQNTVGLKLVSCPEVADLAETTELTIERVEITVMPPPLADGERAGRR